MFTITNPKVSGFQPVWAPFKGFSLLFDNSGSSNYSPLPNHSGLEKIDCRRSDANITFYQTLWNQAASLEKLANTYLFCRLPAHSYHVTVWDGINEFNVNQVSRNYRFEAEDFLKELPASLKSSEPFLTTEEGEPIRIELKGTMKFAFDRLDNSTNTIVVRLKPADRESEQCMEHIVEQREKLLADFRRQFGLSTAVAKYRPHCSLGYFANKELAGMAETAAAALNKKLANDLEGQTLDFSSISLYGMSDMETFYRLVK